MFIKCAIPMLYQSTIPILPSPKMFASSPSSLTKSIPLISTQNKILINNELQIKENVKEEEIEKEKEKEEEKEKKIANENERKWIDLGFTIIKDLFYNAEIIFDYFINNPSKDDVMNILRYGTVLPSVLPIVIIFGISSSSSKGFVQNLSPMISSLIKKLQLLIPCKDPESSPTKNNSPVKNNLSSGSRGYGSPKGMTSSIFKKDDVGSNLLNNQIALDEKINNRNVIVNDEKEKEKDKGTEKDVEKDKEKERKKKEKGREEGKEEEQGEGKVREKDESANFNISTPSSPSKKSILEKNKDLSHSPWISRLLKLATVLKAKLAARLVFDPPLCPPSQDVPVLCLTLTPIEKISKHLVWFYISPSEDLFRLSNPTNIVRTIVQSVSTISQKPGSARLKHLSPLNTNMPIPTTNTTSINSISIKILNICAILRDREALADPMYRSIQQLVKKSANTKFLVQGIEHGIFEAVVHLVGLHILDTSYSSSSSSSSSFSSSLGVDVQPLNHQLQLQHRNRKDLIWKAIAKITMKIQSKRSLLIQNAIGLNWIETLTILLRQTNAIKDLILSSTTMFGISKIPMTKKIKKFPSLRRIVLIIICTLRWKACVRYKIKSCGVVLVEFILEVLEFLTDSFTCVGPPDIISDKWDRLLQCLTNASNDVILFSKGILTAIDTIQDVSYCSLKYDILSNLILAWRSRLIEEKKQEEQYNYNNENYHKNNDNKSNNNDNKNNNNNSALLITTKCCTIYAKIQKYRAFQSFEKYLCRAIEDFSLGYLAGFPTPTSLLEINFFSLILNFVQLISAKKIISNSSSNSKSTYVTNQIIIIDDTCCMSFSNNHKISIFKFLRNVFIAMDSKVQDPSNYLIEERTTNTVRSRTIIRDKKKSLVKTLNSIISLLQEFSGQETQSNLLNLGIKNHNSVCNVCTILLEVHNDILVHLQKMRVLSMQQVIDAEISVNRTTSSSPSRRTSNPNSDGSIEGKDNNNNFNINTTTLLSTIVTAATTTTTTVGALKIPTEIGIGMGIGIGLSNKDNIKKRCQEIVLTPIEFNKNQEGFVVQGDNLLSNFKGLDFTLALWLYIDKKPIIKHNFITGKVSHHDAWPLIVLRNDGKLDIIYGHSNEFECMESISTIQSNLWTHIAVVIEQKKIKLFINGMLDCHIGTRGNARAVMYPIVVGRCPQGLRTHVDHVRTGFDGLLAQYRYYTRALSPIHVRVVFDQGTDRLSVCLFICLSV